MMCGVVDVDYEGLIYRQWIHDISVVFFFFFFKQKTAYEMRISDWSSDVCSSDLYEQEKHERHGGGDAGFYKFEVALDETYEAFLPKLGLAWHLTPQATLGIMASRGYNGGGAGAALGATEATNYQYDPEYVWTYELYEIGRAHV